MPVNFDDLMDTLGDEQVAKIKEVLGASSKELSEDTKDIKTSLVVETTGYPVEVYCIAYSKSMRHNVPKQIPCKRCKPLSNECYDMATDSVVVTCADFLNLGKVVNMGYRLRMLGVNDWRVDVPLPEVLIQKNLPSNAKKALEVFMKKYPEPKYHFSFLQFSGSLASFEGY